MDSDAVAGGDEDGDAATIDPRLLTAPPGQPIMYESQLHLGTQQDLCKTGLTLEVTGEVYSANMHS